MAENNNQNQSRFFTALLLSMGVLLIWSYLFAPKPEENANANLNANAQIAAQQNQQTAATPATPAAPVEQTATDGVPNRTVTIKTPLYEAKLDSRGALASSWILRVNRVGENEKPLYNSASTKDQKFPLELIGDEARARRELPFKIFTGDANFDALLNDRNYQIAGADGGEIVLNAGESKKIDFVLRDEATNSEAVKSFTFKADGYVSDLQIKLTRGGQTVPNAKLQIGANVGDQGIKTYNYYSIEPEAVGFVNGAVERYAPASFTIGGDGKGQVSPAGNAEWAGVGDTYFAMAAIPAIPANGAEFRTVRYEVTLPEPRTNGIWGFFTGDKILKENRHLTTALVPVNADGTNTTKIYTGTKDHFLLTKTSEQLTEEVGRTVDIENFLYYGWFPYLVRPISQPILWALKSLNAFTNSYGVAILIFTFAFFSLLFPLRWYQSKSFKKAAKNAPKMKELQDRYKEMQAKKIPADDPRMRDLQMEQLKLTKDAVPIGGCLPLLLQFPFLIAVYTSITISLDFRQTPFMWLPDLSAGDPLHVLEFLFAGSMALAMLFTPTAPAVTPEQQMQQKMMTYMMPLMMLFVMWGAPSGLLVYWLAGNIIGFGQQMIINRMNKSNDDPPTAATDKAERPKTKKEMKASLSPS